MNEMHFDGKIIHADFHTVSAPAKSSVQLRVIIDVTEEVFIEEQGTIEELSLKFDLDQKSTGDWINQLTGRGCKVLRDAEGYHFVSPEKKSSDL